MEFRRIFPEVPEDLAALSDGELADQLGAFRDVSAKLRRGEIDLAGALLGEGDEATAAELSAEAERQWVEAAEFVREMRAEQTRRVEEEKAFEARAADLDAIFAEGEEEQVEETTEETAEVVADDVETAAAADDDEDDEPKKDEDDEDDEPAETAAVEETETITAGAVVPMRFPSVSGRHTVPASPAHEEGLRVIAASSTALGNARIVPGEALSREAYGEAVVRLAKSLGPVTKSKHGTRDRFLVASARHEFDEEMILRSGDVDGNARKLARIGNPFVGKKHIEAIMAQGGICAPPVPIYTVPTYGVTARPVRDFYPSFQADRGGVSIPGVSTVADTDTDAITIIEAEDDAAGGSAATKSCATMDCPEWTDVFVGAVSHCRVFGNFNARTWPEGVAAENDNTMVLLSRTAEGRLLDRIDALSLKATGMATYGASSTLLYNAIIARARMISYFRLDPSQRVQALLPFWAADMFAADLMHGQFDRFDTPASAIAGLFARYGIDVGYHFDEGLTNNVDEIWGAQGDNAVIRDWPGTQVAMRISLPGVFLHLDGGELELGLIRDSSLIEVNDYELFGEIFENLGRVGPAQAAVRVLVTVCPDGTVAAPDTSPFSCSAT